jgi:hypothetical protein
MSNAKSIIRCSEYKEAAQRLHDHLEIQLDPNKGYPDLPSWGYAFSLLLSANIGHGKLTKLGVHALSSLSHQNHADPNYSWEFVIYAIQQAKRLLPTDVKLPCDIHRSKGTRMFNWFLLRQVNRGWFASNHQWTCLKLRVAKFLYTTREGFILDEFQTRSLQYHAFNLFLICELIEQHPNVEFLKEWLYRGVQFSLNHLLADGTALWLGRGQEQIFGYGSLIYACEYVHAHLTPLPIETLDLLQKRLLSFQREDGSFPLVLRKREPEPKQTSYHANVPGWYGYNTLYDYLPFLGYAMWRTGQMREKYE